MKRALISLIAGAALLVAPISAIAADDATGPLPPGGAAGVEQAQFANFDVPLIWWLGEGAILGFTIYLLVRDDDDTPPPVPAPQPPAPQPPTTTTTTTTTGT